MIDSNNSVYNLDWGDIYVDSYNTNIKTATIIFNFKISQDSYESIFIYSIGQIFWTYKNLPPRSNIVVIFDARGQDFDLGLFEKLEKAIHSHIATLGVRTNINLVLKN